MNSPLRPYGTWVSPLAAADVGGAVIRLAFPSLDDEGRALWVEGRPQEGGRNVLVRQESSGERRDLTPAPFNVRTRVHEYGGLAYLATGDEIYFVNFADQRLYYQDAGGTSPPRVIDDGSGWRLAELVADRPRQRLLAIGERAAGDRPPQNALVAIDGETGSVTVLQSGHDFFASPCLSPDGGQMAWLAWDHPDMPWDAATLWMAAVDDEGRPHNPRRVAGDGTRSVFQPAFGPDGDLYMMFEGGANRRWSLHRERQRQLEPVGEPDGEMGLPLWQLGMSTWGFVGPQEVAAATTEGGIWSLRLIDTASGRTRSLASPFSTISHLAARKSQVVALGGSPHCPSAIVRIDGEGACAWIQRSTELAPPPSLTSLPEAITFATTAGDEAHGFFYPPCNPNCQGPAGEKPPLLVTVHGGPTAAAGTSLHLTVQFWTSRGFAVLDVNYRGSTGYGRPYRDRLRGQWGVFDVDDCVAGGEALAAAGRVDGQRLAIRGSSAGGYTVLAALTFRNTFAAGASYYGVSDLCALARDTHKFEAHYLEGLVGPFPGREDLYRARSPLYAPERLNCPVIFFQGLQDKVVPPAQAEAMVAALRSKGISTDYLTFADEQHGFRRAETIQATLEAELAFYGRVFGFVPAP